jgi:hypothetical protein
MVKNKTFIYLGLHTYIYLLAKIKVLNSRSFTVVLPSRHMASVLSSRIVWTTITSRNLTP